MFSVELKTDNITSALTALQPLLSDMRPVFDQIGEYLVTSTKDRFKAGVSPEGVKWAPKSPTTLARYGARKSNRVDIRPLFGLTPVDAGLNSQIHFEASPTQLEVGSNLIYAAVMQFGAKKGQFGAYSGVNKKGHPFSGVAPWGDIPARPFLGISPEDETNILALIADFLTPVGGP